MPSRRQRQKRNARLRRQRQSRRLPSKRQRPRRCRRRLKISRRR